MWREGTGLTAPSPTVVRVELHEQLCWLDEAAKRTRYRNYASGRSAWKRGLAKGERIPGLGWVHRSVRAVLVGFAGEYAAVRFLNGRLGREVFKLDMALLPGGDGGIDLIGCNARLQIKTRRNTSKNLVRRVTERKAIVPVVCEYYIFAYWGNPPALVQLLGYQTADVLRQECALHKSPCAGHFNLEVPAHLLEPMEGLVARLE